MVRALLQISTWNGLDGRSQWPLFYRPPNAKDSAMLTMLQTFRAVFQDGVFVPETRCELPDGTAVELDVRSATLMPLV